MRRNRKVIQITLNLYKDQKRLLNYFGMICNVASADKYNATINIHKIDGTIGEAQNVGALDLFDNLKIVKPKLPVDELEEVQKENESNYYYGGRA